MADDKPGWMTRTQWSELDDGRHTPLPGRSTVADDPREVAARVLAAEEARGNRPRFTDPYAPPDAATLAREVVRLTEALHEATIEKGKAVARWGIAMSEVARLKALIVDAGHLIGSLGSHAPGDGVTDASTDQCWYCGEAWPCPTAQWREEIR